MNANTALETFAKQLADGGLSHEHLAVPQALPIWLAFYRDQRADDCPADRDCDKLLYQWGTDSEQFEIDFARQFVIGDEDIWNLSLNFKFPATDALHAIGMGDKWCPRPKPQAVDYFEKFIRDSAAYRAVNELKPVRVKLTYFNVS